LMMVVLRMALFDSINVSEHAICVIMQSTMMEPLSLLLPLVTPVRSRFWMLAYPKLLFMGSCFKKRRRKSEETLRSVASNLPSPSVVCIFSLKSFCENYDMVNQDSCEKKNFLQKNWRWRDSCSTFLSSQRKILRDNDA
uniref:Secreted protein n=1 Tax=Gongylonema pulchrum TaxID=637853 RepID=A0A183EMM1_9BILA